ncbi:helix-turn-helix transcriptional regulator [Deferribacter autotrophicus]|uniref:Helix-turn-helix transcriptional regulator n=1 Tax=Deferribacter autotrophicus TaxID=500465 RepID=A0A5A8F6G5_9BACT|nr:helix-turn-helix transcriptional regulator [Deferribacter autotrophicus]KAA0257506.1 helix-turn-helix transcriptional regulator [Deferribacter autotrophicus]
MSLSEKKIERLIGKTIQFWRKNIFGLTGEEFAKRLGTSRVYVSKIESGTAGLSFKKIEQIAKALKISPLTLLRGLPEKEALDTIMEIYRDPKYNVTIKELEALIGAKFRGKHITKKGYLQLLDLIRSGDFAIDSESYRPRDMVDILLDEIEEEINGKK